MLFIYYFISLLIFFSIIGYGLILTKIINFESSKYNFGLLGLLGLFTLSIISSYTHIIIPHNFYHNILIIFIGLIFLFFYSKKKNPDYKYLIIIFSLLFLAFVFSKTNEDYPYYHLPNTLQFAQQKLQFGLGNLSHGFKHMSSLFMLMSLNYLPIFEHYLFNLTNFLFLVFFVSFLIHEIYFSSSKNLNLSQILLSFFLILMLVKFSRIAEYGTDIAGQILVSIFLFYILELIFNKKLNYKKKVLYSKLSIIFIIFAISTKFILAIYSLIFLLMIFLIKEKKKIISQIFKKKYFVLILLPIVFLFFFNFASTGCIIYPIEKTCFTKNFSWSLSSELVNYLNLHYEVWSKGGKGPNFGVDEEETYIKSFNWISNWISVYFFNKFSDYILVIFSIIIVFACFFIKEIFKVKDFKLKPKSNFILFYSCLLIIFLLWFFNFPTLRYAGYIIVYLVIIFPFIFFLEKKVDLKRKNNLKKISIIFLISYSIFFIKNSNRIYDELSVPHSNHHNFKNFPFYWVENVEYEKISIDGFTLYKTSGRCWNVPSTCIRGTHNLKVTEKNGYKFYSNK